MRLPRQAPPIMRTCWRFRGGLAFLLATHDNLDHAIRMQLFLKSRADLRPVHRFYVFVEGVQVV